MKRCGTGFFGFIGLIFLTLLVCKIGMFPNAATEWSWLWITCPLWCLPAIFIGTILLCVAVVIVVAIIIGVCYLVYILVTKFIRKIKSIIKSRKERTQPLNNKGGTR